MKQFQLEVVGIPLRVIGLFRLSVYSWFSLGRLHFFILVIYPFLPGYQDCWHVIFLVVLYDLFLNLFILINLFIYFKFIYFY